MSKLILINAKKMEKILFTIGFNKDRQKGSHVLYKHKNGRTTTVPFHSSKDLARPLIRKIINDIGITIDDYNELVKKN